MAADAIDNAAGDVATLEATLAATMEVVAAQRSQLDSLRAQLAVAQGKEEELKQEVVVERAAREAAELRLREASVDFARRLSAMQARMFESERDLLLGGQVLITRSAPSTAAAAGSDANVDTSHCQRGTASDDISARFTSMSPRPPLGPKPVSKDAGLFTRPTVVHAGIAPKSLRSPAVDDAKLAYANTGGICFTPRRAHSAQKLAPLEELPRTAAALPCCGVGASDVDT